MIFVSLEGFNEEAITFGPGSFGLVSGRSGKGKSSFIEAPLYAAGFCRKSLAVGDFNADGIPDLAVADWYGAQ